MDHLRNICIENQIQLIYTNNKYTILSSGFQNNIPIIRAQRLFRDCDKGIAEAIVYYYIDYKNKEKYLKLLDENIKKIYKLENYRISPPEYSFLNYFKNKFPNTREEIADPLIEADISTMVVKELDGNLVNIPVKESIKINENNITELDIVISPNKR